MAKWVRLSDQYAWVGENMRGMVEYPRGEFFMPDDHAADAIASGVGEEIKKPKGKRANAAGQVVETGDAD